MYFYDIVSSRVNLAPFKLEHVHYQANDLCRGLSTNALSVLTTAHKVHWKFFLVHEMSQKKLLALEIFPWSLHHGQFLVQCCHKRRISGIVLKLTS